MITEIMGFLILLGAGIVFIVRWQSRKDREPVEMQQDMQYSTYQLKSELERTGGEIVSRIEQHVRHLEQLIREADRSRNVLDGRIAEMRELVRLGEEQMDAMHTLRSEIVEARHIQQQLEEAGKQLSAALQGRQPVVERVDAQDFSEVLHQSMARDVQSRQEMPAYFMSTAPVSAQPTRVQTETPPPAPIPVTPPEAPEAEKTEPSYEEPAAEEEMPQQAEEAPEEHVLTDSAKARGLLINGWSVEDVARETGMGRGAVELMQQMLRRQMGDETAS